VFRLARTVGPDSTKGSGLLIRGFGVRVPGGAPVIKALTWGFSSDRSRFQVHSGRLCARRVLGSQRTVRAVGGLDGRDGTPGRLSGVVAGVLGTDDPVGSRDVAGVGRYGTPLRWRLFGAFGAGDGGVGGRPPYGRGQSAGAGAGLAGRRQVQAVVQAFGYAVGCEHGRAPRGVGGAEPGGRAGSSGTRERLDQPVCRTRETSSDGAVSSEFLVVPDVAVVAVIDQAG
jgi:hypothetical protein